MQSKKVFRLSFILGVSLSASHLAQADSTPHYVPQTLHCINSVCDTYYDRRLFILTPPANRNEATYTFAMAETGLSGLTYWYVGANNSPPFSVSLGAITPGGPNQLQPYTQGSKWQNGECGTVPRGQPPTVKAQDCPFTNTPSIQPPTPAPSPGTAALVYTVINHTPFSISAHLSDRNTTITNFKESEIPAGQTSNEGVTMYSDANGNYNSEFFYSIGPKSSDESNMPLISTFGTPGQSGYGFSIVPACKIPVYTAAGQTILINIHGGMPGPVGAPPGEIEFCVNGAAGCDCQF